MRYWFYLVAVFWIGCGAGEGITTIPYSTARIGESTKVGRGDTELKIFNNYEDCSDLVERLNMSRGTLALSGEALKKEIMNCTPWFDRRNGEVRLSFAL